MTHQEAQGRADSTLCRNESAIRVDIVPTLGDIRIDHLSGADIDRLYAQLRKRGLKPLTVRKSHAILSAALHQAVRWGWLDHNPIDQATPPSARSDELTVPSADEVRRLLEVFERSHADLASLIYAAATTGCRRGELCGLRWGDVDLERATLLIARSISDTSRRVSVKDTKTHQSRRISLDPSTVEVLRRHRARAEKRAADAGTALTDVSYVWSQALDGSEPYRPDRVTGTFRQHRDKAGLSKITFRALRHFAATALAGKGVGVRTIAGRLGHANPSVTLRTYAHFLEAAEREAAVVMGDIASAHFETGGGESAAEK